MRHPISCPPIRSRDILSESEQERAGDDPASTRRSPPLLPFDRVDHLPHVSPKRAPRCASAAPTASVGEVVHLMQLEQKAVGDVKCGETHADGNGPFDPVHAQPFVQSTYDALPSHDLPHGPQNSVVRRARDASRLHASSHHIQRVGGGLSNQAGAGTKSQTLIGVRLGPFCFF